MYRMWGADGGCGGFCGCAHACEDQERILDHLEMELQVAVIVQILVLGTEPLSSARDVCSFDL